MKIRSLVLLALLAAATSAPAIDNLTGDARTNWLNSFSADGYPRVTPFAASPFTCNANHKGVFWYDTANNEVKVCNSSSNVTVQSGSIINADVDAAAAIARTKLATDTTQAYPIELKTSTFTSLAGAEAAGTFNAKVATNVIKLEGEVTDNETEASVGYFQRILPAEYVAGTDVVFRFRSALVKSGSPTNNGSTLDLECYLQADAAVGSDLQATAAVTYAALDTYYNKDFTVTGTTLVPGSILSCKVTTSIVDSEAGAGTIIWTSDPIKMFLSIQG